MVMAPYVFHIGPWCCGIHGLRSCVAEVGSETTGWHEFGGGETLHTAWVWGLLNRES